MIVPRPWMLLVALRRGRGRGGLISPFLIGVCLRWRGVGGGVVGESERWDGVYLEGLVATTTKRR